MIAADVAAVSEDDRGADRSDAVHVDDCRLGRINGGDGPGPDVDEGLVQGFELGDELAAGGDPLSDDRVTDRHAGQEFHGPAGAEGPAGAALDEQAQHGMEATHAAGALGAELVVAVRQQPQHDAVFAVGTHAVQRGVADRDDGRGAGVVGVGLVDPAVVHQPDPGRELRGYIDDVLAGSDKLLGQQRTHAGGALDPHRRGSNRAAHSRSRAR